MKITYSRILKMIFVVAALSFICGKCFEDEGILAGGPETSLLTGSWKLQRISTPTGSIEGAQIGYSERMIIADDSGYVSEKTYKNDSLVIKKYWGPYSSHVIDKKKFTYLLSYRYGLKRFYKIYPIYMEGDLMEASGYVSEIGAPDDTVRYFYKGAH